MRHFAAIRTTVLVAALGLACHAQAESFASSASSAGSASSGSVSDSLQGSSHSSTGDNRRADGNYQIIDIEHTPGRPGSTRVAMQGAGPQQRIVLDLPTVVFEKQQLAKGGVINVKNRPYGLAFGRADAGEPFYLVLEDAVFNELAARKVAI
ncbi:MAG: hypothetical protein ABIT83_25150 [Massilia sp.]